VHFADRLVQAVKERQSPVLVGIDPRWDWLPESLRAAFGVDYEGRAAAYAAFGRAVVEVVHRLVPAVKIQAAFFEALGPRGMVALRETAEFASAHGLIVIVDGKRNDIGSTAEAYARAYLGRDPESGGDDGWCSDALTVNPYLGSDGVAPFVEVAAREGTGLFVLVRTSNASAAEFQDLLAEGRPLYRHVADRLASWAGPHRGASGYSLVGAVVGATYPEQLAELRAALPGVILLVPGYGTQGGTARDVASAFDPGGLGAIINNSRGIIFAYRQPRYQQGHGGDWQRAIEQAVSDMRDELAAETPAGRLRS
jgi:orotidine-5'-phosphate decarboxylase